MDIKICIYENIPSEPVARKLPSGENLTTFTAFVCLVKLAKKSRDTLPSALLPTFHIFKKFNRY